MLFQITSRSNDKIKRLVALKDKKNRDKEGVFVAEGKKAMDMALMNNLLLEVYTLKKLSLPKEVSQYIINESVLEKISSTVNPQGIVFVSKIPNYPLVEKDKLIYLDNLQDPGNVGTIIRTALALDYDGVILSKTCADPFNDKALSASKGAIYSLPIIRGELDEFREDSFVIVSTLDKDSISLEEAKIKKPFILVLGNEGNGVSEETLKKADLKINIPMEKMESLNVAIAGAIMMYELNKK